MAVNTLEEKINKIRQQNEEIRRRHEEVEEDKKKAAKLNALVQMIPSTDWPERKEPLEFSNLLRTNNKSKPAKEHHEHCHQYHSASGEGRKVHTFAQGQGPPPDPKYNFLADAEREESNVESTKNNPSNRGQKYLRGMFRRKPGGKDGVQRDYRTNRGPHRDEHQPEYEAWRAERNRIDEDRISRQRTAEGNWRREWDNDKAHVVEEVAKSEAKLGEYVKKDHRDFDRRYHVNGNDYVSHNRGGQRSYRGNSRHFYNNYENCSNNTYHQDGHAKNPGIEKRTVIATDKSIKVTLNQGNMTKGPVTSVKVNSPSIAGTGRVGPRQRSRVTYSSHSDVEIASPDTESFSHPKSEDRTFSHPKYEDRTKNIYQENLQKSSNSRKSQLPPKKKDFSNKSPYFRKKEIKREDESLQKYHETESSQKEHKNSQKFYQFTSQKSEENTGKLLQDDKILITANEKGNDMISSGECDMNNIEIKDKDNQNDNLNSHIDKKNEVYTDKEGETILQNLDLSMSNIDTEIGTCEETGKMGNGLDESTNVQSVATFKYETTETDLTISSVKDDNDKNETKYENSSCDANEDIKETTIVNKHHNSKQTKEILSDNCDNKQTEDRNEQENDVKHDTESSLEEKGVNNVMIPSSTYVCYIAEQSNKLESEDKALKEKETLVMEDEVTITDEKINIRDKQDVTKCTNKTQERTDNNEKENSAANNIVDDKIESLKEDLQVEEKKATLNDVIETEK